MGLVCSYTNYFNDNSNWMSKVDSKLRINEINIPGTHDTGTFNVENFVFMSEQKQLLCI